MKSLTFNVGITTLARIITGLVGLWVIRILTTALGPTGYGYYNTIIAYLFLFSSLADGGLQAIFLREISKNPSDEEKLASNVFTLRLFLSVVFVIVANVIAFFLGYPALVRWGIFIASFSSVGVSLAQVLQPIFQKRMALSALAFSDIVSRAVQVVLLLTLMKIGVGLLFFVIVMAISELVRFGVVFVASYRFYPIRFSINLATWKNILKSAFPVAISLIFILIYFKLDTIILSIMKSGYEVGIYSISYKILELLLFLPATYVGLITPILARTAYRRSFITNFQNGFDIISIFALPCGAILAILSPQIILFIAGATFLPAAGVLAVLSLAIVVIFYSTLYSQSIIALNLQRKTMIIYFLALLLNVALNIIFIPKYSYYAAAWATVATEIFVNAGIGFYIFKAMKFKPVLTRFYKAIFATLCMGALIYWTRSSLILSISLAPIYFLVLFLVGGFNRQELRQFFSLRQPVYPESNLE